uniref:Transmembrane protein n=1 Tax=Heterorhabditis bacteriophora TaxID=37862 RepID=A0A1I7W6Q6_HETBA
MSIRLVPPFVYDEVSSWWISLAPLIFTGCFFFFESLIVFISQGVMLPLRSFLLRTLSRIMGLNLVNTKSSVKMLANPSCWPKTAIVATGVIIYGLIISLYFLCYVPVILGSPIVMIAKGLGYSLWVITLHGIRQICLALTSISNYLYQQRQRRRRINLWTSIPIIMAVYSIQRATSCQEVDVFSIELACVELLVKSVRAHKSVQTGSMPRTLF